MSVSNLRNRILVLMAALLFIAIPVMAQEPTEEPTMVATTAPEVTPAPVEEPLPGEEDPVTTPANLFEQLVNALNSTYILWAAAGVLVLTGLVKMIAKGLFKKTIDGQWAALVAMIFQVAIWIGYSVAVSFGKGDVFKEWYLSVIQLVQSFTPFVGAIFVTQLGYLGAKKIKAPVIGYKPVAKPAA